MHKKLAYRTTDYFFNYGTFVYPKRKIIILYIHFDFHFSRFLFFFERHKYQSGKFKMLSVFLYLLFLCTLEKIQKKIVQHRRWKYQSTNKVGKQIEPLMTSSINGGRRIFRQIPSGYFLRLPRKLNDLVARSFS